MNGHAQVWPESDAVSDGEWVSFYRGPKVVFHCNAAYAATNFIVLGTGSGPDTRAE